MSENAVSSKSWHWPTGHISRLSKRLQISQSLHTYMKPLLTVKNVEMIKILLSFSLIATLLWKRGYSGKHDIIIGAVGNSALHPSSIRPGWVNLARTQCLPFSFPHEISTLQCVKAQLSDKDLKVPPISGHFIMPSLGATSLATNNASACEAVQSMGILVPRRYCTYHFSPLT